MMRSYQHLIAISALVVAALPAALAQTAQQPATDASKTAARTEAKPAPKAEAKPAPAAVQPSGLVVAIDPVTKQIRPPEVSEIQALRPKLPALDAVTPPALRFVYGPGRTVGVVLDESFHSFMVVTKTPDGKLKEDCVTGAKAAQALIQGQTTTKKEAPDVQ